MKVTLIINGNGTTDIVFGSGNYISLPSDVVDGFCEQLTELS